MSLHDRALDIWKAGVAAVDGYTATARALPDTPPDMVLAVGKAAASMARAALDRYGPLPCLVVTKDGHGDGLPDHVHLIEAAHPVPDARSLNGGRALRRAVSEMAEGTRLLLLVSGGASSLAEDPVEGETLESLAALNRELLASGLDIGAMNERRRKLSRVKGGGLLAHFRGGRADVLAISDVPKDDIAVIGSGIGAAHQSPAFDYSCKIVASNAIARTAAEQAADGLTVLCNTESLHNDATEIAQSLGPKIAQMNHGVMVLGGEPTVVLPDTPGEGGRNQMLALALAEHIAGRKDIVIVVGGTDGSDGPTHAAGGVVDGTTWGDGARDALERADSGTYLDQRGARLVTGPTGTNVMDLAIVLRA